MRKPLALVAALATTALAVAAGGTVAHATSPHGQTLGEAQAAFQAFFTGGASIRVHNPDAEGAPKTPGDVFNPPPDSARIYPNAENAVYCREGWHVVMLGDFIAPSDFPGGNKEAFDFLAAADIQFFLDGAPLEIERTAIKRFQHPDPAFSEIPFMAVTFGAFLPPESLSLGTHQLRTLFHDPEFDEDFTVSFTAISC